MATQAAEGISSLADVERVVDSDCHVMESLDDILPYMDGKYVGIREHIEYSQNPLAEVYSVSTATPAYAWTAMTDEEDRVDLDKSQPLSELLEMRDELGLDNIVVNPTLNLLLPSVNNSQYAVAIANAYNSWLVDTIADEPGVYGTGLVATHKPSKAAEEIDRIATETDIVGVQMNAYALFPPPGHEYYDPIYEVAQDRGLPICMHSAIGPLAFPRQYHWAETYVEDHAIQHPFTHMWNLTHMIFEGIPERFPDLDFNFQEAGIGYVPYMVQRLDDHYLESAYEIPYLDKLPSEYVDDQFYFTTQPLGLTPKHPKYIAWMVEMAGVGNVMYSADIPHPDFDPPEELFDRIKTHFDRQDIDAIMGGTATDLFGLEA